MQLLKNLPRIYKAVAAFCALLVPFLTAIATALNDGKVETSEWVMISSAGAALIGGVAAVYQVRNASNAEVKK